MEFESFCYDVHGVTVQIKSHLPDVVADCEHDFFAFKTKAASRPDFVIETRPRAEAPSGWVRLKRQKRSVLYRSSSSETRVEFFKETRVQYRFEEGWARVFSDKSCAAYEAVYFLFLSYTGEKLDRRGLHRIHGLGLEIAGQGVLFLGASGTGKSSLALRLLDNPQIKILSDDTPFVSGGRLYSFAQRIALREKPQFGLEHVRTFKRFEYGEKSVLGAAYFAPKICPSTALSAVVLMKRTQNASSAFVPVSRFRLVLPLLNWLVLGNETPQIWELFLRFNWESFRSKCVITVLRFKAVYQLFSEVNVFELRMSTSPDETAETVQAFRLPKRPAPAFLPEAATNN